LPQHPQSSAVKHLAAVAAPEPAFRLRQLLGRHPEYSLTVRATGDLIGCHDPLYARPAQALRAVIRIQPSSVSTTSSASQGA
jgi:hypothetical protein